MSADPENTREPRAQRYSSPLAFTRMEGGCCPECGFSPEAHLDDDRFWIPRRCSLLPRGVEERIAQYHRDKEARPWLTAP